jgi:hypothetical protein
MSGGVVEIRALSANLAPKQRSGQGIVRWEGAPSSLALDLRLNNLGLVQDLAAPLGLTGAWKQLGGGRAHARLLIEPGTKPAELSVMFDEPKPVVESIGMVALRTETISFSPKNGHGIEVGVSLSGGRWGLKPRAQDVTHAAHTLQQRIQRAVAPLARRSTVPFAGPGQAFVTALYERIGLLGGFLDRLGMSPSQFAVAWQPELPRPVTPSLRAALAVRAPIHTSFGAWKGVIGAGVGLEVAVTRTDRATPRADSVSVTSERGGISIERGNDRHDVSGLVVRHGEIRLTGAMQPNSTRNRTTAATGLALGALSGGGAAVALAVGAGVLVDSALRQDTKPAAAATVDALVAGHLEWLSKPLGWIMFPRFAPTIR